MDLRDRVALITGASGGLGAVTARVPANEGVQVALTHLGHREAVDLCRQIELTGRKTFLMHLDQADPASCSAAIDRVPLADVGSVTPDIWDRAVNTNLRGPVLMTRAAMPHLRRHDRGRVVNVAEAHNESRGRCTAGHRFLPSASVTGRTPVIDSGVVLH